MILSHSVFCLFTQVFISHISSVNDERSVHWLVFESAETKSSVYVYDRWCPGFKHFTYFLSISNVVAENILLLNIFSKSMLKNFFFKTCKNIKTSTENLGKHWYLLECHFHVTQFLNSLQKYLIHNPMLTLRINPFLVIHFTVCSKIQIVTYHNSSKSKSRE